MTEEALNKIFEENLEFDLDHATRRLQKFRDRLDGNLPLDRGLRYLDVGCGVGDIAIALAASGVADISGVDTLPRKIAAAERFSKEAGYDNITFVCTDIHDWHPDEGYDIVMSHEALEHIHDPKQFLQRMAGLTKPNGIAALAFGPLFHSPTGDHMGGFFRIPMPWRGLVFSEQAILRLRTECFRPGDAVLSFGDTDIGLNRLRFSEFLRYVDETGWKLDFLSVNPQLQRFPIVSHLSNACARIPLLRDYCASSVYAMLRRSNEP